MARTKGAKDEKPRKKRATTQKADNQATKNKKPRKRQTGSITVGKQKKKKDETMTAELKIGRSKRA